MRILVTLTLLLGTLTTLGCKGFKSRSSTTEQIEQGDQALVQAAAAEKDLGKYHLALVPMAADREYNWKKRSKAERQEMKQLIARYLALSNGVLELDARKGLYVTRKEEVIMKRNAATEQQRSLENFERIFGENFDPATDQSAQPDFVPTVKI